MILEVRSIQYSRLTGRFILGLLSPYVLKPNLIGIHPSIYIFSLKINYNFRGDGNLAKATTSIGRSCFLCFICHSRIVFTKLHTKFHFSTDVIIKTTMLSGVICASTALSREPRYTAHSGHIKNTCSSVSLTFRHSGHSLVKICFIVTVTC